jgi:lambda family phage portal protein
MSLIENVIQTISPVWALNRERAKVAFNMLRGYEAAQNGRRGGMQGSNAGSANAESVYALTQLRNKSRELVRNNTYAQRAVHVIATNTIGPGIRPSHTGTSELQSRRINDQWKTWAESTDCDYNGQLNFYGLQEQIMKAVAQDGECIIIRRRTRDRNKISIKLQVLEADYLDVNRFQDTLADGTMIMQGVEFDKTGKRIAYWIFDRHPGDPLLTLYPQSSRVRAEDVCHVYRVDRPGQVRGIPFGVSAFLRVRDLDEYQDAELMRRKIAACFAAFVTDTNGISNSKGSVPDRIEPGSVTTLNPGQSISFAAPPATQGYAEYVKSTLQSIAIGYGITYESLTSDLANTSFSSGRMGWLEMHRNIVSWQENIMIAQFCQPVYQWFSDAMELIGYRSASVVTWTPPRREMIDPVKETEGMKQLIRSGMDSWQNQVRKLGRDPQDVIRELKTDHELFISANVVPESDPAFDPNRLNRTDMQPNP